MKFLYSRNKLFWKFFENYFSHSMNWCKIVAQNDIVESWWQFEKGKKETRESKGGFL